MWFEYENPKFDDSRLKNGEKIGDRQTVRRTQEQLELMNSTEPFELSAKLI
jgi:hypothetical protein